MINKMVKLVIDNLRKYSNYYCKFFTDCATGSHLFFEAKHTHIISTGFIDVFLQTSTGPRIAELSQEIDQMTVSSYCYSYYLQRLNTN